MKMNNWITVLIGTIVLLGVAAGGVFFLSTPAQRIAIQNYVTGKTYKKYVVYFVNPTFRFEDVQSKPQELTEQNKKIAVAMLEKAGAENYLFDAQNPIGASPVVYVSLTPEGYNIIRRLPEVSDIREDVSGN